MPRRLLILVVVLVWYSVVGHLRVGDWTSELSLWTRAVAIAPYNPRPHINRAKALYGLGREAEALEEVATAVDLEWERGER